MKKASPRLRDSAPAGRVHATSGPPFRPSLYNGVLFRNRRVRLPEREREGEREREKREDEAIWSRRYANSTAATSE